MSVVVLCCISDTADVSDDTDAERCRELDEGDENIDIVELFLRKLPTSDENVLFAMRFELLTRVIPVLLVLLCVCTRLLVVNREGSANANDKGLLCMDLRSSPRSTSNCALWTHCLFWLRRFWNTAIQHNTERSNTTEALDLTTVVLVCAVLEVTERMAVTVARSAVVAMSQVESLYCCSRHNTHTPHTQYP